LAVANDQPRKDNVMTDTSKALLAASIRVGIFGNRESIEEALEYASSIIDNLQTYDKAVVYTALHVVLNTVADKIAELPDSGDQLPEPPPEVRIDHADLPATGNQLLNDKIADIVDQRIRFQLNAVDHKIRAVDDRLENWFGNNLDIIDERITEVVRNISFTVEVD
jgi:hypothetical protein